MNCPICYDEKMERTDDHSYKNEKGEFVYMKSEYSCVCGYKGIYDRIQKKWYVVDNPLSEFYFGVQSRSELDDDMDDDYASVTGF